IAGLSDIGGGIRGWRRDRLARTRCEKEARDDTGDKGRKSHGHAQKLGRPGIINRTWGARPGGAGPNGSPRLFYRTFEERRVGKTELRVPKAAKGAGEEAQEGREVEAAAGATRGACRGRSARNPSHGRPRADVSSR